MILIVSSIKDYTTNRVIQWLLHLKKDFIRIDELDPIELINIVIDRNGLDFKLKIKNREIYFSKIKSLWYRRGMINLKISIRITKNSKFNNFEIKNYLNSEVEEIIELISDSFNLKTHINGVRNHHLNKLKVLLTASKLGINIPYTIVTTDDKYLNGVGKLITKSLRNCAYFSDLKGTHFMTTEEYLPIGKNGYFPTLFQQKIEKQYEIRAFYLNGKIFSMAIFSQSNKKTVIDYKNYDNENPNRVSPYLLGTKIEKKLVSLMKEVGLNSGSIDLIKSTNGQYFFLEVNPVGQFGMLSHICNYNLEKLIAATL